jgi:uncharacterized protein YcfL
MNTFNPAARRAAAGGMPLCGYFAGRGLDFLASYRAAKSSAATAKISLIVAVFRLIVCAASSRAMVCNRVYSASVIRALTVFIFLAASPFVLAMSEIVSADGLTGNKIEDKVDIIYHYYAYDAECQYKTASGFYTRTEAVA